MEHSVILKVVLVATLAVQVVQGCFVCLCVILVAMHVQVESMLLIRIQLCVLVVLFQDIIVPLAVPSLRRCTHVLLENGPILLEYQQTVSAIHVVWADIQLLELVKYLQVCVTICAQPANIPTRWV